MPHAPTPPTRTPAAPAGPTDGAVDPARVLDRPSDPRHTLFEVRWSGGTLTGTAEAGARPALEAYAARHHAALTVLTPHSAPASVAAPAFLRGTPGEAATHVDEALLGDEVEVLERLGAWARVRLRRTDYLGWLPAAQLAPPYTPSHAVSALRAHAYLGPRIQAPIAAALSWGARLTVRSELADGWSHVVLPDGRDAFVRSAALEAGERPTPRPWHELWPEFLRTPYVWGGATPWGTDCSGLVYQLMRMSGRDVPRDSDEQQAHGRWVDAPEPGDVVAFRGHVGVHLGEDRFVHASTGSMRVCVDRLAERPELRERLLGTVRFDGGAA